MKAKRKRAIEATKIHLRGVLKEALSPPKISCDRLHICACEKARQEERAELKQKIEEVFELHSHCRNVSCVAIIKRDLTEVLGCPVCDVVTAVPDNLSRRENE